MIARVERESTPDPLDEFLYDWLAEERQCLAERKFGAYYSLAFRVVRRSVLRGCLEEDAKDIFQEAITRFLRKAGTERREAAESVRGTLERLQPLDFGEMHRRLVRDWGRDVSVFRDAALRFRIGKPSRDQSSQVASSGWRAQRDEINSRVEPLTRRGDRFLVEMRGQIEPRLQALIAATRAVSERGLEDFIKVLLESAQLRGVPNLERALDCDRAISFVDSTCSICARLPALKIPVNALLIEIARNKFIDLLRKNKVSNGKDAAVRLVDKGPHPLEAVLFGSDVPELAEDIDEVETRRGESSRPSELDEASSVTLYRDFVTFLRVPLTLAELEDAPTAKLDSLRAKYMRLIDVLTAFGRNPDRSQNETASVVGLTREQVKYALRKISDEFQRFCLSHSDLVSADPTVRSEFVTGVIAYHSSDADKETEK